MIRRKWENKVNVTALMGDCGGEWIKKLRKLLGRRRVIVML
jgi:hypothetical protein